MKPEPDMNTAPADFLVRYLEATKPSAPPVLARVLHLFRVA